MLFSRRVPATLLAKFRQFIWPKAGWRRAATYVAHRVRRLPGTPYHIAAGFACGAAVSFTPLLGLHFVSAALLAWLMRASLMASAIGTVVGNPWTFPFIWVWIYTLGRFVLGYEHPASLPGNPTFGELDATIFTVEYLRDNFMDVAVPMIVGGLPTAIIAWFAFYWPLKMLVESYQKARQHRLANPRRKSRKAKLHKNLNAGNVNEPINSGKRQ